MSTAELPISADEALFEVVDGVRLEMVPMSYYSATVMSRLGFELNLYARREKNGEAFTELLFRMPLPADQSRNRRPDVAYVTHDRWPADRPRDPAGNAWDVVPDLAVEVTSPGDHYDEVRAKVFEYFTAGVRLVWVISPSNRVADVFEAPGRLRTVTEEEELDGGEVLPGFRLRLGDLFDPRPEA
jgi:Uma2 family endonuclease